MKITNLYYYTILIVVFFVLGCKKRGTGDKYGGKPTGNYHTQVMYKNDVGSLTDATLDVWKDGVEYFDYSYNANLSLENARYCFWR